MTLDGVMEAPGGEPGYKYSGWSIDYVDEEYVDFNLAVLDEVDTLLLGRVTYESFEAAFAQPDVNNPFSLKMFEMEKYVVSRSLQQTNWNKSYIVSHDIENTIRSLKANEGKAILVNGSGMLVPFLLQHNLVDEIQLLLHPTIMGTGRPLFSDFGERKKLECIDVQRFGSGIVALRYRVNAGD
jgi:dihydrofolate reductase